MLYAQFYAMPRSVLSTDGACALLAHSPELAAVLGNVQRLDESILLRLVERSSLDDWNSVLAAARNAIFSVRREAAALADLRYFVQASLTACVDADKSQHLSSTLAWLDNVNENDELLNSSEVKVNSEVMVRACQRGEHFKALLLYQSGFKLTSRLAKHRDLEGEDDPMDVLLELSRLEAMATPVYLLAASRAEICGDPAHSALILLEVCAARMNELRVFEDRFEEIRGKLTTFLCRLLDCCDDKVEVREAKTRFYLLYSFCDLFGNVGSVDPLVVGRVEAELAARAAIYARLSKSQET